MAKTEIRSAERCRPKRVVQKIADRRCNRWGGQGCRSYPVKVKVVRGWLLMVEYHEKDIKNREAVEGAVNVALPCASFWIK